MAKKKGIVASAEIAKKENFSALTFTQDDIPAMLEKVSLQIAAIRGNMDDKPHTTSELEPFGKIADINSVSDLLKAGSMVNGKEAGYNAYFDTIADKTGIKKPVFKLNGSTPAQWNADIERRIIEVANEGKLKQLNAVKAKLEANLSEKAKWERDMADCAVILTNDEYTED